MQLVVGIRDNALISLIDYLLPIINTKEGHEGIEAIDKLMKIKDFIPLNIINNIIECLSNVNNNSSNIDMTKKSKLAINELSNRKIGLLYEQPLPSYDIFKKSGGAHSYEGEGEFLTKKAKMAINDSYLSSQSYETHESYDLEATEPPYFHEGEDESLTKKAKMAINDSYSSFQSYEAHESYDILEATETPYSYEGEDELLTKKSKLAINDSYSSSQSYETHESHDILEKMKTLEVMNYYEGEDKAVKSPREGYAEILKSYRQEAKHDFQKANTYKNGLYVALKWQLVGAYMAAVITSDENESLQLPQDIKGVTNLLDVGILNLKLNNLNIEEVSELATNNNIIDEAERITKDALDALEGIDVPKLMLDFMDITSAVDIDDSLNQSEKNKGIRDGSLIARLLLERISAGMEIDGFLSEAVKEFKYNSEIDDLQEKSRNIVSKALDKAISKEQSGEYHDDLREEIVSREALNLLVYNRSLLERSEEIIENLLIDKFKDKTYKDLLNSRFSGLLNYKIGCVGIVYDNPILNSPNFGNIMHYSYLSGGTAAVNRIINGCIDGYDIANVITNTDGWAKRVEKPNEREQSRHI